MNDDDSFEQRDANSITFAEEDDESSHDQDENPREEDARQQTRRAKYESVWDEFEQSSHFDCLRLEDWRLDPFSIGFLREQWFKLLWERQGKEAKYLCELQQGQHQQLLRSCSAIASGTLDYYYSMQDSIGNNQWHDHQETGRRLEKIFLEGCTFGEQDCTEEEELASVEMFVDFMKLIGDELRGFDLTGFHSNSQQALLALQRGVQEIPSLNYLCWNSVDWRGAEVGESWYNLLTTRQQPRLVKNDDDDDNYDDDQPDEPAGFKYLEFWFSQFETSAFQGLLRGLRHTHHPLQRLYMRDCQVNNERLVDLVDALKDNAASLSVLDISKNNFGGETAFACFTTLLRKLNNLELLDVVLCPLFDDTVVLDDSRAQLELDDDHERDVSGSFLRFCKALEGNTSLRTLNLSYCGLTNAMASPLFAALRHNKTLLDLDVMHSDGDESISLSLAQHAEHFKGLRTLAAKMDFDHELLKKALFQNTSILKIYSDPLSDPLPPHIRQNIQRNKILEHLPTLLGERRSDACSLWGHKPVDHSSWTNWPHVVEQLSRRYSSNVVENEFGEIGTKLENDDETDGIRVGLSATFLFVSASLPTLISENSQE